MHDKGRYHSLTGSRKEDGQECRRVVKVLPGSPALPRLFAPDPGAARRFIELFTANIRNPHTRRAYARAAVEFSIWCEHEDSRELSDIEPIHVAAYVETSGLRLAAPSVKQHLAAIRMLFDWLVGGQVIAVNAASPVRGHSFRATGITEYLRNGGRREIAQQMANLESARTTGLYGRRNDELSLDDVEKSSSEESRCRTRTISIACRGTAFLRI